MKEEKSQLNHTQTQGHRNQKRRNIRFQRPKISKRIKKKYILQLRRKRINSKKSKYSIFPFTLDEPFMSKNHNFYISKTKHIDWNQISYDDQLQLIQNYIKKNYPESKFRDSESFINQIKTSFRGNISERKKSKHFNFMNLKFVFCQFLSEESINKEYLQKLSAFEQTILVCFLKRYKYFDESIEPSFCLINTPEKLEALRSKSKGKLSELQVYQIAIREIFKKLMYSFCQGQKKFSFYKNMKIIHLNKQETNDFYTHYFKDCTKEGEEIKDFFISESMLLDLEKITEYTNKMKQSKKMIDDILKYFLDPKANASNFKQYLEEDEFGKEFIRRIKFNIADKVNKRVNNYEIVLNQWDACEDKKKIIMWMSIIYRDFMRNPNVKVPNQISNVQESVKRFLKKMLD